jgi:hypothetical protein
MTTTVSPLFGFTDLQPAPDLHEMKFPFPSPNVKTIVPASSGFSVWTIPVSFFIGSEYSTTAAQAQKQPEPFHLKISGVFQTVRQPTSSIGSGGPDTQSRQPLAGRTHWPFRLNDGGALPEHESGLIHDFCHAPSGQRRKTP